MDDTEVTIWARVDIDLCDGPFLRVGTHDRDGSHTVISLDRKQARILRQHINEFLEESDD